MSPDLKRHQAVLESQGRLIKRIKPKCRLGLYFPMLDKHSNDCDDLLERQAQEFRQKRRSE